MKIQKGNINRVRVSFVRCARWAVSSEQEKEGAGADVEVSYGYLNYTCVATI